MDPRAGMIDRDREWHELERAWNSGRPELIFVVGRRRAGKSFLLTRFVQSHRGLYYQATKRTEREQLRALSLVAGEHFADAALTSGVPFPEWEAFLGYVTRRAEGKPFVLVLDEFPYLLEAAPALPSIIQALWDHQLPGSKLKIVLSGSYITAMKRLTEADQPLHGRRTRRIDVAPFSYRDAARFVPRYSPVDRVVAYGIFGGLPGHLAALDAERSLRENVADLVLNPASRLFDEAAHAFDAFLGDAAVHYSIVEAIAAGEHKWSKIANRIGKQASSISRPLSWLLDMAVVERVAPITAGPRPNPKAVRYRLKDPHLAFWHRFMVPIRSTGAAELLVPEELWTRFIMPGLNDYMGGVFEETARSYVRLEKGKSLPFQPVRVGEWWSATSEDQIDLVALGDSGELLVGECKWGRVGTRDLATLRARAAVLGKELGRATNVFLALFSGGPITDQVLARQVKDGEVLHMQVKDLFA